MVRALAALNVVSALIVIGQADAKIERSARNLPKIKVLRVDGINVYDVLGHEHLILTQEALQRLEARLGA
jgi:large subunit ribosomal protein L4